MLKYCLFDLDGTLSDSGEGIMNGVRYAVKQLGEEMPDGGTLRKFIGPPLWESFETFCGYDEEKVNRAVKLYREYYSEKGLFENRLYDGIEEALKKLKDGGCTLAVATSKPETFSVRILEGFGIAHYFHNITGTPFDGKDVTKADVISLALERCGVKDKAQAIMVGDRKHDIIGAKENGLKCVAVLYGYGSRGEFEEYGADFIAATPDEAAEIVLR